jgi:hypothetical protein
MCLLLELLLKITGFLHVHHFLNSLKRKRHLHYHHHPQKVS